MPTYGHHHQVLRKRWVPKVRTGTVACWRCGKLIPASAKWDLGHVDNPALQRVLGSRHPEHQRCNRATVTNLKEALEFERAAGRRDPAPENDGDRWSRHWFGGFTLRCPDCRATGAPCDAAADEEVSD